MEETVVNDSDKTSTNKLTRIDASKISALSLVVVRLFWFITFSYFKL